jgi:hypothetical protein
VLRRRRAKFPRPEKRTQSLPPPPECNNSMPAARKDGGILPYHILRAAENAGVDLFDLVFQSRFPLNFMLNIPNFYKS